jgi:hypothetical protein
MSLEKEKLIAQIKDEINECLETVNAHSQTLLEHEDIECVFAISTQRPKGDNRLQTVRVSQFIKRENIWDM